MVDILTKSGCSRYVEFKAISKVCVYQSGRVEQVSKELVLCFVYITSLIGTMFTV